MAAFDDLLVLVELEDLGRGERVGVVGGERVDAVGRGGGGDRGLVARVGEGRLAVAGAGVDVQQRCEVGAEDRGDALFDVLAGRVVAAAEATLDAGECRFGFGQGALACGGDLAALL